MTAHLLPYGMRIFLLTVLLFSAQIRANAAEPVHRLTREEFETTLDFWEEQHSEILEVVRIGESREGLGIFILKITDPSVPPETKQHALITALHGGPERSGTTGCLRVIEWLLSDDEDARLTREKQEVWLIPIINPYAYFTTDRFGNSLKIDPYTGGGIANWDLETLSFRALDRSPELASFLQVVDDFQPESHLDLHGTGLQEYPDEKLGTRERYQGQIMTEITGSAYSNFALRPWDWRITEAMIRGGEKAGYPSDRFEADAQQLFTGSLTGKIAPLHWRGRAQFYSAQYGYAKYHTLIAALEIAWEESALARTNAWLRFGNEAPSGEMEVGYPVDRVKAFVGHFITASGKNAAERRKSRISLWQSQAEFSHGFLYPQTDGRILYAIATDAATRDSLASDSEEFLENLENHESIEVGPIRKFIEDGPEIKMAVEHGRDFAVFHKDGVEDNPLAHGIGFRIRIPYLDVTIDELMLNGRPLNEAKTNGFEAFPGNGFTQVQINLDGTEALAANDVFVIICRYTPKQKRSVGWTPPKEVLQRLKE